MLVLVLVVVGGGSEADREISSLVSSGVWMGRPIYVELSRLQVVCRSEAHTQCCLP